YSAEPRPKPAAPASTHGFIVPALTPPTTSTRIPAGSTVRCARSTDGELASAGNSLSACPPAATALSPSVGVAYPGRDARPAAAVALMTLVSVLGDTISRPPAIRTASTSRTVSTVPAPTRTPAPC